MPERWMVITFSLHGLPFEVIEPITSVMARHCGGVEELTGEAARQQIRGHLPATDQGKMSLSKLKGDIRRLAKTNTMDYRQLLQRCSTQIVENTDWASNWKSFYQPVRIGQHFVVHPSWEKPDSLRPDDQVIMMDPGQAFGTGHHESSRLCIELMELLDIDHWKVADIGCGSGILSIVAARAGAEIVWACDIDKVALETAEQNMLRNDVESVVNLVPGSVRHLEPYSPFRLVFANLLADILQEMGPELKAITRPGGYMIWSGILKHQVQDMEDLCEVLEVELQQVQQENEWIALLILVP